MIKIKPCPFCGSKNVRLVYPLETPDVLAVHCSFCGATGPNVYTTKAGIDYPVHKKEDIETAMEREAIRRWNLAKR